MCVNIPYTFHRIPDTQPHFITKVHDFTGTTLVSIGIENQFLVFFLSGCLRQVLLFLYM